MTSPDPVQPDAAPPVSECSHWNGRDLKEWACYLVLAGLIGLFCYDLLIGGQVPFFRDLTNYAYPLRWSLFEALHEGRSPLWDRHFAQGFPNLAAFQTGTFYPPHWIMVVVPFYASIRLLCVFHFLVAGLGAFALMRHWNHPRDLAMVGAILFALGGTIVSMSNLLNHFQSAVWLPWLVLAWDRLLTRPAWREFVVFVVVLTVQFLAGSPEFTAMSLGLACVAGLGFNGSADVMSSDTAQARRPMLPGHPAMRLWKTIGLMAAGIVAMAGLAMIQILPTAELIGQTYRGSGTDTNTLVWSLEPASLLNLFVMDHEVDLTARSGVRYLFGRPMPLFLSSYIGVIGLFGIVLWGWYSTAREKMVLGGLIVLSIAVALGEYTPVYPLCLRLFPFFDSVRFPEKYFFVTYVLLIVVVIRGLHRFYTDASRSLAGPIAAMGMALAVWVGLGVATLVAPETFGGNGSSFGKQMLWQCALAVAVFSLMVLGRMSARRRVPVSAVLVGMVFLDLTWAHRSHLYPLDPQPLEAAPRIVAPESTRLTRYFYYPSRDNLHPYKFNVAGQVSHPQEIALFYQNWLPNMGVMHGIDYFQELDALGRRAYSDFLAVGQTLDASQQVRLLRSFNVRHVVSFQKFPEPTDGIRKVGYAPESRAWLYEIEDPVPRAFLATKFIVGDDPGRTLRTLANPAFDARDIVIIDRDLGVPQNANGVGDARVEIVEYAHDRVVLTASCRSDALLVLADAHDPNWRAYVDGIETPIARANHFHRAIKVPAGNRQVEFRYDPRSFKRGATVSVVTGFFLIVVTMILIGRTRCKKP